VQSTNCRLPAPICLRPSLTTEMNHTRASRPTVPPMPAIALGIALAFPLAHTKAHAQIAINWVNAVTENQTFRVFEPTLVRYGAGVSWIQRTLNGSVNCSNAFFGRDPAAGVLKLCQIPSKDTHSAIQSTAAPAVMWVKASNEYQTFTLSSATEVRYGAGANWIQKTVNGKVTCSNGFFGSDPARNIVKSCELLNLPSDSAAPSPAPIPTVPASGWIRVAGEYQTFNLNGPTEVRFGEGAKWVQRTLNGAVRCNIDAFGSDPARNILKSCEIPGNYVTSTAPAKSQTQTPAPTPIPVPVPVPVPQSPTPVAMPVNPFSCAVGAITCIEVTSTGLGAQATVPVTFGQPFKAGDWRASSQGLVAKVDDMAVPLQIDETSSHRDGSTRFAVLSAQLGGLTAGQTKILNLYTGVKTPAGPTVPANPDWHLEVETQVFDANGNVTATLVAQPQAQLVTQITNNKGRRLSGVVASEYTVVTDFKDKQTGVPHPHLTARFHTRLVDSGARIRTDVVMENTRSWTAAPGNITYAMAIKRNGVTLHTQPKFTHFHHARWHKVVWTGSSAEPQIRVRHNMPYFMASRAVWNFDLGVRITESALATAHKNLIKARAEQAEFGPMGNTMLEKRMPNTGGRGEIGPYPKWTVNYLLSQDPRALEVMLAVADSAGSVPIHYRDENTDSSIDIDRHPTISSNPKWSTPKLPAEVNGDTFWTPDIAHQGSYAYVPYLITGDAYYLDEMMFWSAWNTVSTDPGYRGGGQGLAKHNQLRGQSWAMRAMGEVYRALPDNHPRKAHFASRLAINLDWYANEYPRNPQAAQLFPLNAFPKPDEKYKTGPWQNDFMGIVFAQLAENDEPKAYETLAWMSKFNLGRFNSENAGFCTADAPGYYWEILRADKSPITSWSELYQKNFSGAVCDSSRPVGGSPDSAGGYAGGARAMMASASNAGIPGAKEAYSRWKALTPKMEDNFTKGSSWTIVPRP
jgi:hypothetical protein